MGKQSYVRFILAMLAIMGIFIPGFGAASPESHDSGLIGTPPDLNITGTDIANQTIPSQYGITPTLIDVKIEISDIPLPAPKGEMAASPRTIGFSADPLLFATLVVAICAGTGGIWYLAQRKSGEPDEEE